MKAKIAFLLLGGILFLASFSSAQTIDTVWTQNYWNGYFDSVNCVQETIDRGFILTGTFRDTLMTYDDVFLLKTDSLGNVEWQQQYGTEMSDCGYHVFQSYDGGYVISANTYGLGYSGGGIIWIIKTDQMGDTLWTFPFSPDDRFGYPLYAIETIDSGIAVTGLLNVYGDSHDMFILKLDRYGNYISHNHYGGYNYQWGEFICQLPDNGFIITGWDDNYYTTGYDFSAIRTDNSLAVIWASEYAITDFTEEMYGSCMVEDGVIMVGQARGVGHAMKIDFNGNTVWSNEISLEPYYERFTTVCPTSDGGLMVGGWIGVSGHRRDFCFLKLNADGEYIDHFTVGGSQDDHGAYIAQTYDGAYVMTGTSRSFVNGSSSYLVKASETFNSPIGANVEVPLDSGVTVTFESITGHGVTGVDVTTEGPIPPGSFLTTPADPFTYYNIATTATITGTIEICIEYDPLLLESIEEHIKLIHYHGEEWTDITTSLDTENNIVCGETDSLSPFILGQVVQGNCCVNIAGNTDNDLDDIVDVSDLLFLVDYQFVPGSPAPMCPEEADVDGDGVSDISDLLFLVDYQFVPGSPAPVTCP